MPLIRALLDPLTTELGPLRDELVTLRVVERHGLSQTQTPPGYVFAIEALGPGRSRELGRLLVRVDDTPAVRTWAGHLAYEIEPRHRGHRYAARACRLALEVARLHLECAWLMAAPDNPASRRTAELAGGEYVDTRALPPDSDIRALGLSEVCRYRFVLGPRAAQPKK